MAAKALVGVQGPVRCSLEGLSTRETGLDIVPPLDVVAFVSFPAQQNHPAVSHRWKINQSVVVVFQLNAERLKVTSSDGQIKQELRVVFAVWQTAATVFGSFGGVLSGFPKSAQSAMRALNFFHDRPHVFEKRIRFVNGKQLHTMLTILLSRGGGRYSRW